MIVKRFYDSTLAQASYLIGCGRTGTAIVIDPNRDVEQYLAAAESEGVEITHVTETHIHADFVSGSRELAARTGAALYLSGEGGTDWRYEYAEAAGAILVRHGDVIRVGNVHLGVVHTPGHTPEHISLLVTDTAAADQPMAIVTGDFVFVGDVGRPDLLERAVGMQGTAVEAARTLWRSLLAFKDQPDWLQIWPGHGAGSACGKGLSAVPHSTVGYERRFNWAFGVHDESEFVRQVLAGQPDAPKYFADMKRINKQGPRVLHGIRRPERLPVSRLHELLADGAMIVDTRRASDFAAGHVPNTVNIPLNTSFTTWAGWLVPFDRDVHVIVDDECADCVDRAVRDLALIGLDRVAGYFGSTVVAEWKSHGNETGTVPQLSARDLARHVSTGMVTVLDVRNAGEWDAGHLSDATHIPLGHLVDRLDEIPRDRPIVVHCQGGARSAIAASLLLARGVSKVANLVGGFADWQAGGFPVVTEHAEHAGAHP